MAATLRFLNGNQAGATFQVRPGEPCLLGREQGCAVVIDLGRVSRRHLELVVEGGCLRMRRLSRTNPVYCNGEECQETALSVHDVIAIGGVSLQVLSLDSGTRPRLPVPELERLPALDDRAQYHSLVQCMMSIQALLAEDGSHLVERSIELVFHAVPATRLALFTVAADGSVQQGYTTCTGADDERRLSHGLARTVLQAGRAILLEELNDEVLEREGQTLRDQDVRSAVGVPVRVGGRVVAVLIGDNRERPGALDQEHAQVLEFAGLALGWAWQRDLLRRLRQQQQQTEHQLSAARLVQERICNKQLDRSVGGVDWAVQYRPALELGGDFYDVHHDGDVVTWIQADVSGTGVPAALVVSMLRAYSKMLVQRQPDPVALLWELDCLLRGEIPENMYATACVCQAHGRRLRWCALGCPDALVISADGRVRRLAADQGVLALALNNLERGSLRMREHELAPGERFCLVTDGITEARNEEQEEFGYARIGSSLGSSRGRPAAVQTADLVDAALRFGGGRQSDDITVILAQA